MNLMGGILEGLAERLLGIGLFGRPYQVVKNVDGLADRAVRLVAGERAQMADVPTTRALCVQRRMVGNAYVRWCQRLGEEPRFHRKQWEYVSIARALEERELLREGHRGLGFAVGAEPLVAAFAAAGCEVTATDIDGASWQARHWRQRGQYADGMAAMNARGLCPAELFASRVRRRAVDMRAIPRDLVGYDFCWSSCAAQHLGSIEAGLSFIERALDALRPGGVAVHTVQFNLSPGRRRIEQAPTVYFTRDRIERFAEKLAQRGDEVAPLDWDEGDGLLDAFVDVPPYRAEPHLKLFAQGLVTTSLAFVVTRGGQGAQR